MSWLSRIQIKFDYIGLISRKFSVYYDKEKLLKTAGKSRKKNPQNVRSYVATWKVSLLNNLTIFSQISWSYFSNFKDWTGLMLSKANLSIFHWKRFYSRKRELHDLPGRTYVQLIIIQGVRILHCSFPLRRKISWRLNALLVALVHHKTH